MKNIMDKIFKISSELYKYYGSDESLNVVMASTVYCNDPVTMLSYLYELEWSESLPIAPKVCPFCGKIKETKFRVYHPVKHDSECELYNVISDLETFILEKGII